MLPYEYAVLLKALKKLSVTNINVYFEASSVSDESLNGHVHHVSQYFNKRFYKYTETGRDYHAEVGDQIVSHHEEESKSSKSLFISEGNLLPSKTELGLAKKGQFDLYTITNLSLMDIAHYLTLKPIMFAVTKHDLSNKNEVVHEFKNISHFSFAKTTVNLKADEAVISRKEVHLQHDAVFDVTVRKKTHREKRKTD
jgi:hypothetical protein